jgi:hypothetical protein
MKKSLLLGVSLVLFSFVLYAPATVRYVDASNTNPVSPYTSWATAATNIQDAASLAVYGDTVLVTNGIYQYGGTTFDGTNRVRVFGSVLLKSVNGPAVTTIVGYQMPGTTNGSSAVRCVYLSEFATLSGFTLTNGATPSTSGFGGGVVMESSCWVSNCIIVNNAAATEGGGCYSGNGSPIINSWIAGNTAPTGGGFYGVSSAPVVNCIVTNNSAGNGSGVALCSVYDSLLTGNGQNLHNGSAAYISTLVNCTVAGNSSIGLGAANGCTLVNSIIYDNHNAAYADCYQCYLTNSCTTIGSGNNGPLVNGCISNAPGFVNPSSDFHLNGWSHCIAAGDASIVTNSTDLDGNPRVINGAVDMGCYENQSPFQGAAHYVSLLSTNPTPPYTNWVTAATNIQDAVAVAQAGEYVIVDDGIYTNAGAVVYGAETNRVALTNGIALLSTGGAQAAQIVGGPQTRCAYVGPSSVLMGFTLTNGAGRNGGDITNEQSGGGAWCAAGGVVSNCFIIGNRANTTAGQGGGVYGGAIYNSVITNNNYGYGAVASAALYNCTVISNGWVSGSEYAGGLYYGTASNCLIAANRAYFGGAGVYHATVWNSTIMANQSIGGQGAGAYQSQLYGCFVLTNLAGNTAGGAYLSFLSNCTVSGNPGTGAFQCTNRNCTFSGNFGPDGGGVNNCISYDCTFVGNYSASGGAGQNGTFYDCLIVSNAANNGGGAYNATLYNCTVVGNTATNSGGGVNATGGSINNSIVYFNNAATGPNWSGAKFNYSCTTPAAVGGPTSSITNAPIFVNMAAGDFHEQTNSATINDGSNSYATNSTDFDGNPRIVGGTVDIGAYEYQGSNYNLPIPVQWLIQYGLPTDGSQNYAYSDNSGMNNWQKWIAGLVPTNSASVLIMMSPSPTNNSSGITVTWQSVTNRTYFLQCSTNLTGQPAFWSIQSNIPGQHGTTSYTDTSATNGGPYFYRVGVQ